MESKNIEFKENIENSQKIAIFGHEYIDGDSLGSSSALGKVLEKLNKNVSYFTPVKPSESFKFLENSKNYNTEFDFEDYDLIIICDTSSPVSQLGKFWNGNEEYFQNKKIIVIDHHESNSYYGDINIVGPNVASTCNIVYGLIKQNWENLIDSEIATCLYLGISTDTGNFFHKNAKSETFKIAGELLEKGAKKEEVIENVYKNNSLNSVKFLSKLLGKLTKKGNIIYIYFSDKEIKKAGVDAEVAKSVMQMVTSINEGDVYILLRKDKKILKGSIRSKGPEAKKIASELFGGGGHPSAAGFKVENEKIFENNFEDKVEEITDKINNYLNN